MKSKPIVLHKLTVLYQAAGLFAELCYCPAKLGIVSSFIQTGMTRLMSYAVENCHNSCQLMTAKAIHSGALKSVNRYQQVTEYRSQ
ncbi:hypothetical protein SG34_032280 [Thalassomonas viridans]|uniref:Uncharacterized protein n=1 Tax=Thalassomonas viridans TaxID=137584 RepID=A0AAE9Z9N4_9GAMM|nr:hypothetical protein [Thalassomonas viridans]WDE08600.1 hypothetical protein SG34_032280 [Thalassomonas viridans]